MRLTRLATAVAATTVAAAAIATAGAGTAQATTYYGDKVRSSIYYSGTNCMNYVIWKEDGSKFDGYTCRGVVEVDQIVNKGDWLGIEPTPAAGLYVSCHTFNLRTYETIVSKGEYWDEDYAGSGSLGSLFGPPPPMCMFQA